MDKIISIIIAIALFIGGIIFLVDKSVIYDYDVNATVCNVCGDEVTVCDERGMVWRFYGSGLNEGDACTLLMVDNDTETMYDDKIVEVIPCN